MSDIFQEVDEALQKEKIEKIWHDHKDKIVTAIAALIIGTGAISFYNGWDLKKDGKDTAKLITAIEGDLNVENLESVADDTRKGVATISNFLVSGLQLEENKTEDAIQTFNQIIDKTAPNDGIEDLARILKSQYSEDHEADLKVLKPVLADKNSPFHWHARLEAATIEADKNQNFEKAIEYLTPINQAENVSATLKQRANALSHIYKIQLNQKAEDEQS
ncbi:MAG: hypothetical protein AAF244_00195 [Pseudomonadota bacterium]